MKQFGRYEVIDELGAGGMARVFRAHDPRLRREVAVKVISTFVSDKDQSHERFFQEAAVMVQLAHPAIVPIYDFGQQDGHPYIVMRLMKGGSLGDRLKQEGPLSLAEVTGLLQQLAPALEMAHGQGMVHRDLKPDNILLDQSGNASIADFGLAKVLSASIAWTKTGQMHGSPPYMSPEQAVGRSDLDQQSDIYSLGVILFEALTGKWPYNSDNPIGFGMMHNYDPIPNICNLNPNLPAGCKEIIERVLAKKPQERYASVTGLVKALNALPSVHAQTIPLPNTVDYLTRGNEYYQEKSYDLAISQYNQAVHLRPDDANALLSRGNTYYSKGEYDLAIADYTETLRIQPNYGNAYYNRGNAYQYKRQLDLAIADYDQALRINPNNVTALLERGNVYSHKGQLDEAIADYDEALRIKPNYAQASKKRQEAALKRDEAQQEAITKQKEAPLIQQVDQREQLPKAVRQALATMRDHTLRPTVRAEAGRKLAQLGDPRAEVMTVNGMQFCFVPAGPFWTGSKVESEVRWFSFLGVPNHKYPPLHEINIPVDYWIGRYPVTNAQFMEFLDEEGYGYGPDWAEAKRHGHWKNGKIGGRDRPHDHGTPYNLPNHPVVGVTWYEALAFTRWLNRRWPGSPAARLCTEAEWEKAARGGIEIPATALIRPATNLYNPSGFSMKENPLPQRHHPWGNDFDSTYANSIKSGIGKTNAVGCFVNGQSPYGLEEMSGNVSEWCQSLFKKHPYRPDDGREKLDFGVIRVIRGGSYLNKDTKTNCFSRSWSGPAHSLNGLGFRVFRPYHYHYHYNL